MVAIAITSIDPAVDAPGKVEDNVTLTLRSQRRVTLQDPGVGARDRVGVFEAFIDDAVDYGFPAKYAQMLRDFVCRKQHEVFRHAIQGHPPASVEYMSTTTRCKNVSGEAISYRTCLP